MICTSDRPRMLAACLASLHRQELAPRYDVEICVVDNSETGSARDVVAQSRRRSDTPIHYQHEIRKGIPFARNRTLDAALEHGYDWIALIDDDERARPNWIASLLDVAEVFDADVVSGPVIRKYETPLPRWWKTLKPIAGPAGTILSEAPTNNTLFGQRLIDPLCDGLRFNTALTFGFEDIDFFQRAHAAGRKIVWAPDAVVEEDIPHSRVQPARLLQRAMSSAAAHAYATRLRRRSRLTTTVFALKGVRRVIGGALLAAVAWPLHLGGIDAASNLHFKGRLRFARGFGNLRGLTRHLPDYYSTVDGN